MARDFDVYLYDPTFSSVPIQFEGPWQDAPANRQVRARPQASGRQDCRTRSVQVKGQLAGTDDHRKMSQKPVRNPSGDQKVFVGPRESEAPSGDVAATTDSRDATSRPNAIRRSLLLGAVAAVVTDSVHAITRDSAAATADPESEAAAAESEWLQLWKRGPTRVRWTSLPIQVGDKAPDLELLDASGSTVRLGDIWRGNPTIVVFLRHFGCSCARDRVARLKQEHAGYIAAGANVVAIGQGEPARARKFALMHGLPCPLLCDPSRRAYEAYGLLEGRPSQVVYGMPDEFLRCDAETGAEFQLSRRGTQAAPVDNPFQLPGEFVIDQQGVLCLTYRSQYCADFGEPQVLAAAVREARLGLKFG